MRIEKLLELSLISLLGVGCFCQILTIFQFYLSYSTNVFIETKFDSTERQFPAISFCNVLDTYAFNNSHTVFNEFVIEDIVTSTIVSHRNEVVSNESGNFHRNAIETVSAQFYCFTLNSLMKGEFKTLV